MGVLQKFSLIGETKKMGLSMFLFDSPDVEFS
jgi:hypothetical protein